MLFEFNKQTVFINCYYVRTNTGSKAINNLSKLKYENKLASLAEAAIISLENYSAIGFKIFFIETSGFDNLSILQIYHYMNDSINLLNLTITLIVDNKAYRLLFIDNEPKLLGFDDIIVEKKENQFDIQKKLGF